jgi:hypothetical protein
MTWGGGRRPPTLFPGLPEAARLRQAGLLWPENLTDIELEQEVHAVRVGDSPIATRMLVDEVARRRGNRRHDPA